MRRRNPAGVPLDLFDDGYRTAPYAYPYEDASLSQDEKARRWQAIQAHRDATAKRDTVGEMRTKYGEIYAEILRQVQQQAWKIGHPGAVDPFEARRRALVRSSRSARWRATSWRSS